MTVPFLIAFVCMTLALSGDPVSDAWNTLEETRKSTFKEPRALNPPATEKEIGKLEKHLGLKLPKQLRKSLLLHNGMKDDYGIAIVEDEHMGHYLRWLSIKEIQQQWDRDRQREREAAAEGDRYQVHPKFIPIFVEPMERDDIIYLDSSNGTLLQYCVPSSTEIQAHRYSDLTSFLNVIEHHIRNKLIFEWGNDIDAESVTAVPMLNKEGVEKLIHSQKEQVVFKLTDGKAVEMKQGGHEFANSILESFKPVKFTRVPGVQNPDHELVFSIDGQTHTIAVKLAPEGKLSYSIGNQQFAGGDPEKFRALVKTIQSDRKK